MVVKQEKIILYKNRGETPLECIERFKKENPQYKYEKMTYAGRLDPLAEGLLLVLVGEECKNKEKYLSFDKEYEVDVLFGFATDSYDLLGIVKDNIYDKHSFLLSRESKNECLNFGDDEYFKKTIKSFIGKFSQKYPPFSSKTIGGKSLFSLFKKGKLKDEEIPKKEVEIKDIKILGSKTISKDFLSDYIKSSIDSVKGDFRQGKILKKWKSVLNKTKQNNFLIISLKVECTSGTYMRSLANSIGQKVNIPVLALNIKRTKIGDFKI